MPGPGPAACLPEAKVCSSLLCHSALQPTQAHLPFACVSKVPPA